MTRFLCSGIRNHGVQHELCALRGDRGEWICPTEAAGRPFREEIQTAVQTEYIFLKEMKHETGLVCLPTQLERTLQLYWRW
jgi:hypothetical protein